MQTLFCPRPSTSLTSFTQWLPPAAVAYGSIAMTLSAQADEMGSIQIKCEPDVQIFLNMSLKGVTNADVGGLIIQNVIPGQYELNAVKPGFQPQADTVTVIAEHVVVFKVKPFIPNVKTIQEGKEYWTEVKLETM